LRPTLLTHVEKKLFTSLFRLAMEDVDMFSEMRNCMSRMPWEELHGVGDGHDSSWFKSEIRDGNGSHSIAASQAPEIQPLAPPSISFPHLILSPSSSQHRSNLDRRIPHTSEPKDITVDVDSSANIGSQEEAGDPADAMDAMDIDREDPATNPQTSSEKYGKMREKEIRAANVPLPQIHKLRLKGPQSKPLVKGKKRTMIEDEEEDEEEEEEETVRSPLKLTADN
jgi:hypothetical protein